MEAAWIKLLMVLFSMPGFGVEPDAGAPSAAEVTRYAPAQADFVFFADLQSFVPNNYQAVTGLPAQPQIKGDAQASAIAGQLIAQMEGARAMVRASQGIDPVTDVKWVAAWVNLPDAGDPTVIAAVRGNFPADLIGRIAGATGGQARKLAAGQMVDLPDGQSVGMTADGTVLAGSSALVSARLGTGWKPAKAAPGLVRILDGKPFLALASSPSPRAIRRIAKELSGDEAALARDLFASHTFAALAFAHDGVSWTWTDRSARGYGRAALASDGVLELMRAGHLGTRGMVRLLLACIGSYASQSPEIAAIDRNQAEILRLTESFTGDGSFQAKVERDAAGRTISVHAWDKELTKVIPGVGAAVLAGAVAMLATSGGSKSPVMTPAAVPSRKRAGSPP
ncbi:MAG TPA: hypothetical protein VL172_20045 [Kofleriaceae bacterium]|nr:hypothetical protein [Kofleriaceae bacterium]